ncbi:MAG: extracellular solute-binding protein [Epulopiscium sp.]|nr:extracellular solute-binding protein [Candidatus Epulonipiscium sp.]
MKRTISVALSIFLAFSLLLVGCGGKGEDKGTSSNTPTNNKADSAKKEVENFNKTGLPIVNEPVTLRIAGAKNQVIAKSYDELQFFKDLEERTNVKIQWDITPNEGWQEKKSLIFASGDLPDAFYGMWVLQNGSFTENDLFNYGQQGMLIPLDEMIPEYAPNLAAFLDENPHYTQQLTTPDGHIYGLPGIDESSPAVTEALFMNTDWLQQVGKEIPTTTDELYDVLKAFKGKDLNGNGKNDEIPMSFRFNDGNKGPYSLFGSFGLLDSRTHIVLDGDEVVFSAVRPEYKEALQYFRRLFEEGLIDQEVFTHDNKVYDSKVKNAEPIIGSFVAWGLNSMFGTTEVDYAPVLPLKGPNGDQMWNRRPGGLRSKGAFVITSACKTPEVAMRWANELYEEDTAIQSYRGLYNIAIEKTEDGKIKPITPPEGKTAGELRHAESPGVSSLHFMPKAFVAKNVETPAGREKDELDALYIPFIPDKVFPELFYTQEQNERLLELQSDIVEYANEMYAKWMTSGGIEQEWDAYVKKLQDMGVEEMVKILQDAYDVSLNVK